MHVLLLFLSFIFTSLAVQDLATDFRTSKNVIIGISIGGSSHSKWVLEIASILAERGHNITFLTREDQRNNAQHYPTIRTHYLGEAVFPDPKVVSTAIEDKGFPKLMAYFLSFLNRDYLKEVSYYKQHFFDPESDWTPDLFVCDAFNDACIDSATELKVPLIVTCTFIQDQAFHLPYINQIGTAPHYTSDKMSLWERLYTNYVELPLLAYRTHPEFIHLNRLRERAGYRPLGLRPFKNKEHALKLVNSFDGFRPAHYHDTLTHNVGPIMSPKKSNLTLPEQLFLDQHQRVVYVAFGQHAAPNKRDLELLLGGLLFLLDAKLIDGVMWVRLEDHVKGMGKTSLRHQGRWLSFQEVLHLESIFAIPWASQFAILQHPSTALFVSHGGAESAHEALYSGTRMLIHPFFAEQEMNGQALMEAGVAIANRRGRVTVDMIKQQMAMILKDRDGQFERNLVRMKSLAQINSNRKYVAADLMEEHMFSSVEGVAIHRIEASTKMPWWKARNLDLHLIVVSSLSVVVYGALCFLKWIGSFTSKIYL